MSLASSHPGPRGVVRGQHARREGRIPPLASVGAESGSPSTRSISSRETPPGRSSSGGPSRQATIVDSIPTGVAPPSSTASMRPSRSARTWCGVGRADPAGTVRRRRRHRPADARPGAPGRADGREPARPRCRAPRGRGRRRGRPAQRGTTSVSGPGQNAAASSARTVVEHGPSPARPPTSGDVGDEGVEARPLLGGVDARHRRRIGRVGAQPVDRLRREGDEPAAPQDRGRLGQTPPRRRRKPPRPARGSAPCPMAPWRCDSIVHP